MIAGYITASKTILAKVEESTKTPKLFNLAEYDNSEFSGFESVISLYYRKYKPAKTIACFGIAGPVIDNKVSATNLPWKFDAAELKEKLNIPTVKICNDIYATAKGLFELNEDKFFVLNKGEKKKDGHIGIIAAGHGLGQGLVYHDNGKYYPYESEGGHTGFTPGNQLEIELWEHLYSNFGFVEAEDVVSLRGLERMYEFMIFRKRETKPDWLKKAKDKPAKIIEHALSGKDEIAVLTLDLFVDCLANETANLALKGLTLGGIYLCGIIAPQIITVLEHERFMDRFVQRGKMASLLEQIPVSVIIEEKTALIGAGKIAYEMIL